MPDLCMQGLLDHVRLNTGPPKSSLLVDSDYDYLGPRVLNVTIFRFLTLSSGSNPCMVNYIENWYDHSDVPPSENREIEAKTMVYTRSYARIFWRVLIIPNFL